MQPLNRDYIGAMGQHEARWQRRREAPLEDLAQVHERITEPQARIIEHYWALRGRGGRTQLERFYLIADVPVAEIGRALGISRQAIRKQQLLLEAECAGRGDEKSLSRKVDYEWALTGTRPDTQLLRFYIVTPLPTFAIRRGWRLSEIRIFGGVTKQAISRQRKLWSEYRRKNGLKPALKKKQPSPHHARRA